MKALFIGQMVRVTAVRRSENSHKVGVQGRIVEINDHFDGPVIYGLDTLPIRYVQMHNGIHATGMAAWQLEPILPEGSAPSGFTYQQLMDSLKEKVA